MTTSALPASFLKYCGEAASRFDAKRARRYTASIWREARKMDTPAVYRAVEVAAELLRGAGVEDVHIEDVPADGKTSYNGWLMPVAWEMKEGWLRSAVGKGSSAECFADYAVDFQSVATGCPSTPKGKIVEGPVVVTDDPAKVAGLRLNGKFLLVTTGKGSIDINVTAARKGALGVLLMHGGATPTGRTFLNAAVPMDDQRPCVPCFSLSKESAERLIAHLAKDPGFVLRARVRARRYAGTAPVLTGMIGKGSPEVYVCAHIDEIGALDNASGCGVAIEALRVMVQLQKAKGSAPQGRAIRFMFSTEVRGQQAWFNIKKPLPRFLGGINLDMVGSAKEMIVGRRGFRHRPHFAVHVLDAAVALANRRVKGIPNEKGANYVSDGIAGIYAPGGNVSLEQKTGPTYHSSDDVPALLDCGALSWTGIAAVAFLYAVTRMKGAEALCLARFIREQALASVGKDDFKRVATRALLELKTLTVALPPAPRGYGLASSADHYKQGVSRRSGMWPEVEDEVELRRVTADVQKALTAVSEKAEGAPEVSAAAKKVPLALQRGFLNFDDHVTDARVRKLKKATGLGIGWSTETWAWMPDTCFDGKHTVAEVSSYLQSLGINVDVNRVAALASYLEEIGLVKMRPVLNKAAFVKVLKAIGVKRGSSLLVHSSLSAYGYVEGGAATVVDALREVLGPKGTLLMPTHSNNLLGTEPYDAATSRSNVGAVSEYFRKLPGVVRGAHPTHSVAGIGPAAAELVGSQRVDQAPMARDGFWGRHYDAGGDVLLLCPIRSATAFHVGEKWIELPQPSMVVHALDSDGRRRVHTVPNAPWHVGHFEGTMANPLMKKKIMRSAVLGESTLYWAPVRAMIDISIEVNRRDPMVSVAKNGACTCFYCEGLKAGLAKGKAVTPLKKKGR